MPKPHRHSESSVRKFGGCVSDYLPIHNFLDSSKGAIPDNRHRALTHTSWFLSFVLERVFGEVIINSDGHTVSVRDIGEQHILEDFGCFIPTAQDFLQEMEYQPWMQNGKGVPSSHRRLSSKGEVKPGFSFNGD